MKAKTVLGLAAGVAIGYYLKGKKDSGELDQFGNDLSKMKDDAKKKLMNTVDKGKNQVEYLKSRGKNMMEEGKKELDDMSSC